jgi:hypothetical protein
MDWRHRAKRLAHNESFHIIPGRLWLLLVEKLIKADL